ncbi:hypothetical protein DESC_580059 [Desulfosarcina cetonica]|nr:hypothetical protein DESC_580059 [Desulfosarcina cetonica]
MFLWDKFYKSSQPVTSPKKVESVYLNFF